MYPLPIVLIILVAFAVTALTLFGLLLKDAFAERRRRCPAPQDYRLLERLIEELSFNVA